MQRSIVGTAVQAVRHPGKVRASFRNPGQDIEAYAKVSLKKYKPMAARNEDRNVSSGLL